jgi:hypothetical protein
MPKTRKGRAINASGLTQGEWLGAVGEVPITDLDKLADAWRAGEDPCEWREYYARANKVKP